jgi:uncharacterized protein (TIGR02246 family)
MDKEEQAIHQLRDAWKAAVDAKDLGKILSLITDDVVFLTPGSSPIVGKQAVEDLFKVAFSKYRVKQNFVYDEIKVLGDWAYAWGHDESALIPLAGGPTIRTKGFGMMILRREAEGWKYARSINNMSR